MWWKKTSRKALDLCCFGGTFSSHHKMSSKYLLPLSISEQTQEDLNPPALCSPPLRRTTHTACGRVEGRELQQRSPAKNKETNFISIKFFSYHIYATYWLHLHRAVLPGLGMMLRCSCSSRPEQQGNKITKCFHWKFKNKNGNFKKSDLLATDTSVYMLEGSTGLRESVAHGTLK